LPSYAIVIAISDLSGRGDPFVARFMDITRIAASLRSSQ
jgi:hypothetical protein